MACFAVLATLAAFAATGNAWALEPVPNPAGPRLHARVTDGGAEPTMSVSVVRSSPADTTTYEIVQHGGTVGPFRWSCRPYTTTKGFATCSSVAPCVDPPETYNCTRVPAPRMFDATSFDLVAAGSDIVLDTLEVPDLQARVLRRDDVVVGRATPNHDFDIVVESADAASSSVRSIASDASGYLRADFSPSTSNPHDIRATDLVRAEWTDANGSSWQRYVNQLVLEISGGHVRATRRPSGYFTVRVERPDGRPAINPWQLGTQPKDAVVLPGDHLVVEDNGGVDQLDVDVPDLTATLLHPGRRVVGQLSPGPTDTQAHWRLYGMLSTTSPPTSDAMLPRTPDGHFDVQMPDAGYSARHWGVGITTGGLAVATVRAVDDNDTSVWASSTIPGFTVDLDTGWMGFDYRAHVDEQCPTIRVNDGRPDIRAHANEVDCYVRLLPIPARGRTITLLEPGTSRVIGTSVVPRLSFTADLATGELRAGFDPGTASDLVFAAGQGYAELPHYYRERWTAGVFWGTCRTSGSCSATIDELPTDGDVRVVLRSSGESWSAYTRSVPVQPPFVIAYDATHGRLETRYTVPAGTYYAEVIRSGDYYEPVARRTVVTTTRRRLQLDLTASDGRPIAMPGDEVRLYLRGGSLFGTVRMDMPLLRIDQQDGRVTAHVHAGFIPGVGEFRIGDSLVAPGPDGSIPVSATIDPCSSITLTYANEDHHELTIADKRWCWGATDANDASAYLTVAGADFSARMVRVIRDGRVVAAAPLDYAHPSFVSRSVLTEPVRSGDIVELSGTGQTTRSVVPSFGSIVDISGDRIIATAAPGTAIRVQAKRADHSWITSEGLTSPLGRFVAQFGVHGPQPVDLDMDVSRTAVTVASDDHRGSVMNRSKLLERTFRLDTGDLLVNGSLDRALAIRRICGTRVERVDAPTPNGSATIPGASFQHLGLDDGCAVAIHDTTGTEITTTEVPRLAVDVTGSVDGSPTILSVSTEPLATVVVTLPGGEGREHSSDASGTMRIELAPDVRVAWLSLRDRSGAVWRRRVELPIARTTAPPPTSTPPTPTMPANTTSIATNGAHVIDPSGVSVSVPAGSFTGAFLRVDPNADPMDRVAALKATSRGFAAGSLFVDVTISDAGDLADELDVHDLPVPIRVVVPVPASSSLPDNQLAPAWFSDGRWKLSPRITPGRLPRELSDGWWITRGADGVRSVIFLTRHLTEFGVLRDTRRPTWRGRGVILRPFHTRRGTVLRWRPAWDASGIASYRVYVNGRLVRRTGSRARGVPLPARLLRRMHVRSYCIEAFDRHALRARRCVRASAGARRISGRS